MKVKVLGSLFGLGLCLALSAGPAAASNVIISSGFGNVRPLSPSDPLAFTNYSNEAVVTRSATGTSLMSVQPDIPSVLYGKALRLLGVEFCYGASANAPLMFAEINTYTHSTGPGTRQQRLLDLTVREDTACRYYKLATPARISTESGVNFFFGGNWAVAGAAFHVGRISFVFSTTNLAAPAPTSADEFVEDAAAPAAGAVSTASPN
jgi:hypothetical protein